MSNCELFDLNGKVAVVTGGNGGLGRGIALGLARAGAAIAVLGRNEAQNSAVLEELRSVGSNPVTAYPFTKVGVFACIARPWRSRWASS
jgi:NAD(P)-dependent dehydrogenase (short-subunit alcohol dehydrogenase family)